MLGCKEEEQGIWWVNLVGVGAGIGVGGGGCDEFEEDDSVFFHLFIF